MDPKTVMKQSVMIIEIVVIACTLSLISANVSAREEPSYIILINSDTGDDNASCLQSYSTPCKTLSYAIDFINITSLSNSDVILQGDHYINHTLTVSDVGGLTLRGNQLRKSTIHCLPPSSSIDIGSGLLFISVSNLHVSNVIFEGCGTLQYSTTFRNGDNVKYRSAVYIINSTNISFSESSFHKSVGRGLSLHDTVGHIEIRNSTFVENKISNEDKTILFGGGGIHIEFTYCSPGYPLCNFKDNMHNKNSSYMIKDCMFVGNRATNNEVTEQAHIIQFRRLTGSDGNNAGQGGGIHITFKGNNSRNSIEIINCTFTNNSAQSGGGIDATFQDHSQENTLNITGCTFTDNLALERTGGALRLGYVSRSTVGLNNITIQDTFFRNNSAGEGGAIYFFSRRYKTVINSRLQVINCELIGNTASIGAAISFRPTAGSSLFDGITLTPRICRCSFINNQISNNTAFLKSGNHTAKHVVQSGILHSESVEVQFCDSVHFRESRGSAIGAISSQINLEEHTVVQFVNNTATYGGAMALLDFSILKLYPHSQIVFDSNHAIELGGAVYATSPHQTEFIFSHKCFISTSFFIHPENWTTSLTFINNTAKYGHAFYTDSLFPCAKSVHDITTDINSALRWKPFKYYPPIKQYTIATSPAAIKFTLPLDIAPGERVDIHSVATDDLNQPIPTAYQVFLDNVRGEATTNPYIADEGYLQIRGEPGTEFILTLQTQNTRHVSLSQIGRLGDCPLGFTLKNYSCICSAGTTDKHFLGITECDMSEFRAILQIGYWVGCTETDDIITSYCPSGYCSYQNSSGTLNLVISKSCQEMNETNFCTQHRHGQLCGECEEGYSVYYHSENFKCGACPYGAVGLLIYIFAELIPLILLFAVIMVMKLKMTSGLMQSLLLFAQTITLIDRVPSVISLSQTSQIFVRIHTFLLGFLSLDFFRLDELSFCLWSGATVMDNLAFHYVTTLFTILLLGTLVLVAKDNTLKTKVICCKTIRSLAGKTNIFKNSIVHGISTFLILSYTLYTVTSFQILSRITIHGEGEEIYRSVVYLQGNMDYFGVSHLPYAIPAVIVLLFFSIPPPLLLISYPLLWKIKVKVKCNAKALESENDTTIWPIRKLLPLIDSFQGVFRDKYRMFAGLLFLWRFILTAIFAFSSDLTQFFVSTEIALLIFFTIHAVVRPYKRRLHNMIDVMMLANLSIINALTWYISVASFDSSAGQAIEVALLFKLLLMYLPIVCLVVLIILWLPRKCGVLPEWMHCPSSEEEMAKAADNYKFNKALRKMTVQQRQDTHADEDLFVRAAEINSPPLILTSSEAGFELQSAEKSQVNTYTTTCD